MKVAINKCFGGFGLSDEATILYAKKKGIELFKKGNTSTFSDFYTTPTFDQDSYFYPDFYEEETRCDPDLISTIEELGGKANGTHAAIKIVEIPDDIEWHIDEYDGHESIHENHRSWY
jgi:hypothetical protein